MGLEAEVEVCHHLQLASRGNSFIGSGAYPSWSNFESEIQNFLDLRRGQVARDSRVSGPRVIASHDQKRDEAEHSRKVAEPAPLADSSYGLLPTNLPWIRVCGVFSPYHLWPG